MAPFVVLVFHIPLLFFFRKITWEPKICNQSGGLKKPRVIADQKPKLFGEGDRGLWGDHLGLGEDGVCVTLKQWHWVLIHHCVLIS
jgi:hypothetical protein